MTLSICFRTARSIARSRFFGRGRQLFGTNRFGSMMSPIPLCTCCMASMAIVVGYGGRDVVVCSSGGGIIVVG